MRAVLPVLALLLAGCAAPSHGDHAGEGHEGEGPRLLLGVLNNGTRDLDVSFRVLAEDGRLVWNDVLTATAGANPEKFQPLPGPGNYTIELEYSSAAGEERDVGNDRLTIDTAECPGMTHLTFVVDTRAGIVPTELRRECH